MKCEELAAIMERAKAAPSLGYAFTHYKTDVDALLDWTHSLECKAEVLHDQLKAANLQNRELLESLQNMVGLFDNAVSRLKLGKSFSDMHEEAAKLARAVLEKYAEKPKCDHVGVPVRRFGLGDILCCVGCGAFVDETPTEKRYCECPASQSKAITVNGCCPGCNLEIR